MANISMPKKRGRPPILKNYSDPMKSPMAYSSLQMQKMGAQTFTKPLMKVTTSSVSTPSPRKRRNSSLNLEASPSSTGGSAKKARHRGTLLATPVRRPRSHSNSSPLTPSDNIFSSETKRQILKSSPIEFEAVETPKKPQGYAEELSDTPFKFSLCIGEDGKAKIAGPVSTSKVVVPSPKKMPLSTFDKRKVLGLLKKMKSTRKEIAPSPVSPPTSKAAMVRPSEVFSTVPPSSPQQVGNSQLTMPWTPRCTSVFQFRTGFTPNIAIDEVLEEPEKTLESQDGKQGRNKSLSRSNSFVFKLSSGDPLLMTDDPNTELLLTHPQANPAVELFYQQLLNSPRKPVTCFNTPPSLMNLGSPRPTSMQESSSIPPIVVTATDSANRFSQSKRSVPSTPVAEPTQEYTLSIQCTPLIQQTMNGSLNRPINDSFTQKPSKAQKPKLMEQDDARLALRKLISGLE
ncbi:LAFE_0F01618g1_1 [Lachancea fermentati]|uniref:LAFE_0F01618g1_1 n=1 Tax=Lachancea fermentati TaxID=4955 RepID=A0A1G4MEL5_LACFM|nr:LAFE_0F01618g1_1 [Lachancea fermentati]